MDDKFKEKVLEMLVENAKSLDNQQRQIEKVVPEMNKISSILEKIDQRLDRIEFNQTDAQDHDDV